MRSLVVLRLLLNATALALAVRASSLRMWSVVEPPAWASRDLAPRDRLVRLSLSPSEYCLDAANGTSDCHAYAVLLAQPDRAVFNLTALDLGDEQLRAATASNRLQAATSGWCVAAGSSGGASADGSWLLQGAQSMLCLVVLETCLYSALLWQLMGLCSVLCSLGTLFKWPAFEASAGFATLAQTALGALVLIEWAGYSTYMMDAGYVAMLQLVVHYGASFRLAMLSTLLALLAYHLSIKISFPRSSFLLAKLHALPSSPRRRGWSPQHAGSPPSADSAEVESEDATLDCLEQAIDPLKCPANYRT